MKTYIFDIDGTISKNGNPVEAYITESIENLNSKNNVIFASARPIRDILPLLPKKFHNSLIVGCNGGMIWEKGDLKNIHYFQSENLKIILNYLKKNKLPYVLDSAWKYSFSSIKHPFHNYIASLSDNKISEEKIINEGVTKILVLDNNEGELIHNFLQSKSIMYSSAYHKKDDFFDLTPQKDDKYLSLSEYGIDFSSVISFGNDSNDFTMLDNSFISVFIGSDTIYENASYYCEMKDIPKILKRIEHV